jgi:hypothetical protein
MTSHLIVKMTESDLSFNFLSVQATRNHKLVIAVIAANSPCNMATFEQNVRFNLSDQKSTLSVDCPKNLKIKILSFNLPTILVQNYC